MKNKNARYLLENKYGKGCMFKKANIAKRIENLYPTIKGYRKFVVEKRYKSKKLKQLENTLTYHHLTHRYEGGRTDLENGAIVNEMAHRYLHSLPRNQEELINDMLRDYKQKIDLRGGILVPRDEDIQIMEPFVIELDKNLDLDDCEEIPLYDNVEEIRDKKFNRAKNKQETRRLIDEELYGYDDFEL